MAQEPALWVILAVLLAAVPAAALLFTGLWVVRLVQKYHLFSEEAEPDREKPGKDPPKEDTEK